MTATALDVAVFAWLVAVSAAGCAAHIWARRQTPPEMRQERRMDAAIAGLAAFYSLGYLVVMSGAVSILAWSRFFRGVSLIAFPLVWCAPAILRGQRWQRDRLAARQLVERAAEMTGSR